MTVPTGFAVFPNEDMNMPKTLATNKFTNIVQYTWDLPIGGHFPALQEPKLLAEDIFNFVSKVQTLQGK